MYALKYVHVFLSQSTPVYIKITSYTLNTFAPDRELIAYKNK